MSQRSGADALVRALGEGGVRCVFGIPGTQTVQLFESLRRRRMRTVLATSEMGAAFMAGGWARATGEPGVLITIPGPGFTWALTGLAEAKLDSIPLVHVTIAPAHSPGRRFGQQEIDQRAIAGALVKGIIEPKEAGEIAPAVVEALRLAQTGEPGPVLLQVGAEALEGIATDSRSTLPRLESSAPPPAFDAVRDRLARAERPLLFVGQGALGHSEQLQTLAEALPAPVLTTPSARGVLSEDHRSALGFDGLGGDLAQLNILLDCCDLVLVLGAKLGHNGTCGFGLRLNKDKLVHLDASVEVLGANYPASLAIVGDVGAALSVLVENSYSQSRWTLPEIAGWRERLMPRDGAALEPRIGDGGFFEAFRNALPAKAIVVLDSGQHQILARRHFRVRSARGLLIPADLQSMGFGVPTAIGAALAAPDRPVVALVGDGGFGMTGLELLTAVREKLTLVVLVFADGQLGQIRLQQLAEYGVSHAVKLQNPEFALLAEALGIRYVLAEEHFEAVLRSAFMAPGITLIEVSVGDGPGLRRVAAAARLREGVRKVASPTLLGFLRRLRGRRDR